LLAGNAGARQKKIDDSAEMLPYAKPWACAR